MTASEAILAVVREDDPSADHLVVQAFDPHYRRKRRILAYADKSPVSSIIGHPDATACRTQQARRAEVMKTILARLGSESLRETVLFPHRTCEHAGWLYLISRHREAARYRRQLASARELGDYARRSTAWILEFQQLTQHSQTCTVREALTDRPPTLPGGETSQRGAMAVVERLISAQTAAAQALQGTLPLACRHGDYCYWNYLVDRRGDFCVYDWEDADVRAHVAGDVFTNIVSLSLAARRMQAHRKSLADLFDENRDNTGVFSDLRAGMQAFAERYAIEPTGLPVYFAYGYLCLLDKTWGDEARRRILAAADDVLEWLGRASSER